MNVRKKLSGVDVYDPDTKLFCEKVTKNKFSYNEVWKTVYKNSDNTKDMPWLIKNDTCDNNSKICKVNTFSPKNGLINQHRNLISILEITKIDLI